MSRYPEQRVYSLIQKLPIFSHLSKVVMRFLWQVTTVEDYKPGSLVSYGYDKAHFDFIFIVKGLITCKLDQLRFESDLKSQKTSTYVPILKDEYLDIKTVTEKRLKHLRGKVWKDYENHATLRMQIEDNLREESVESLNPKE